MRKWISSPTAPSPLVSLGQAVLVVDYAGRCWWWPPGCAGGDWQEDCSNHSVRPALLTVGVVAAALMSGLRCGWWQTGVWPDRVRSLATSAVAAALAGRADAGGCRLDPRCARRRLCRALWVILLAHRTVVGSLLAGVRQLASQRAVPGAARTSPVAVRRQRLPCGEPGPAPDGMDDDRVVTACGCLPANHADTVSTAGDTIAGVLRALFQPGERSHNLHVAFCPPMPGRPTVEVVQLSGPRTRVKAADVQPFGVRFDLRLASGQSAARRMS